MKNMKLYTANQVRKMLEGLRVEEEKPHGTTHYSNKDICTKCAERDIHNQLAQQVNQKITEIIKEL